MGTGILKQLEEAIRGLNKAIWTEATDRLVMIRHSDWLASVTQMPAHKAEGALVGVANRTNESAYTDAIDALTRLVRRHVVNHAKQLLWRFEITSLSELTPEKLDDFVRAANWQFMYAESSLRSA